MKKLSASVLSIIGGFSVLFGAETARAGSGPEAPVLVAIFNTCQGNPCIGGATGGGAPYSGFVGDFRSGAIKFGASKGFNFHPFAQAGFGADFTSTLFVGKTSTPTFTLTSDDGSQLFIDGALVVDDGGIHGPATVSGSTSLAAGTHRLEVQFFECCGPPSGVDLTLPAGVKYGFPGVPDSPDCVTVSLKSLKVQFGNLGLAASALGFPSAPLLTRGVNLYCSLSD